MEILFLFLFECYLEFGGDLSLNGILDRNLVRLVMSCCVFFELSVKWGGRGFDYLASDVDKIFRINDIHRDFFTQICNSLGLFT